MLGTAADGTSNFITNVESGPSLAVNDRAEAVLKFIDVERDRRKGVIVFVVELLATTSGGHNISDSPLSNNFPVIR